MRALTITALAVAILASPAAAQKDAAKQGLEPEMTYVGALGYTSPSIPGLEDVWGSGFGLRIGTEVELSSVTDGFVGRYVDLVGDVLLSSFGTTDAYSGVDALLAVTGAAGAKLSLPTALHPYGLLQLGFTTFQAGSFVLEDALTTVVGAGVEYTLGENVLSAFADWRHVRTLGGDAYAPVMAGLRVYVK